MSTTLDRLQHGLDRHSRRTWRRRAIISMLSTWWWITTRVAALALTVEGDTHTEPVKANSNDIQHLQREGAYIVSQIMPETGGVTVGIDEVVAGTGLIHFKVSSADLTSLLSERIRGALQKYLSLRLEGHSQEYALYLVLHGTDKWPEDAEALDERNPDVKEAIAFPWIRRDVHASIAFFDVKESKDMAALYVIDGDLAWIFFVPKKGGDPKYHTLLSWRMDAVEFSPAAFKSVHSVFDEMKSKNRTPTVANRIDWTWWFEFHENLEKRTGLQWRTPLELNPETTWEPRF